MSFGFRHLTVLGEFKPYGLIAEALDGRKTNEEGEYKYFLFDPKILKQTENGKDGENKGEYDTWQGDNEIFIRGKRIMWSTGSRVCKRFTSSSPVIMACWCRLGSTPEVSLCVLQSDRLTIYNISGEVTSVPIPPTITSIWPLPFGLLLQQAIEGYSATYAPFSSSSPSLIARNLFHSSPQYSFSGSLPDNLGMGYTASRPSHLFLRDPLEELQPTIIEERGKFNVMKEFDDRTIWTSDYVPLMVTYNKGKMQHSLWLAQSMSSNLEVANSKSSDVSPAGVLLSEFSFRRLWQGKGAQTASSKVFLTTDEESDAIICLLLQDQKKLLLLRLQTVEINGEILYDIKPDMSWSIPAVAAEPVTVTRPRVRMGSLPSSDIVVLTAEDTLLLYSGKHCLCRYVLPSCLWKGENLSTLMPVETSSTNDYKIVGLGDAVDGRINLRLNNGKILRCALRSSPSSSLANDCINAMSEGLKHSFYNHFLSLLWSNGDSTYLSEPDSSADFEWESYASVIIHMSTKSGCFERRLNDPVSHSSWDFLIHSNFHKKYSRTHFIERNSIGVSLDHEKFNSVQSYTSSQGLEESFNSELLVETLNVLHAVYESLKLDNLRKNDLGLLVVLLCDVAAFLGEGSYLDHYIRDFPGLSKKFGMRALSIGKMPPSLFRWLEDCLRYGCSIAKMNDIPPLICKDESTVMSWARKVVAFYSLLCGAKPSGKNLSTGVCCNIAFGSSSSSEELVVLAMVGERFGLQQIDVLPFGMSLPLRHALDKCRESPPTDWPAAAYVLLGREDLAWSHLSCSSKSEKLDPRTSTNLISMSTPYMLHLHPITIPSSSFSDTIGGENTNFEAIEPVDGSATDGMDHIFNSSTQLRFGCDLRLNEVRRLLCSCRPVAIQTSLNPTSSEQDSQQAQLWHLAQRTTALPFGRGAFTLATTSTLLTEALAVPKLVLAGRLPAQQNATVNLDPSTRNIPELISWPEFHNSVAAGLRLSPLQEIMSRTWILYNKPEQPNAIHAGMLLALGLHGHLRVLKITDIYQYYSEEHEITTVGLMLGLAASYRGTMQPAMSKSLYVHISARHPSSFPELELPTLLQSAALVSVGFLYEGSAHLQTMQTLLSELGRRSGGDNVLEREGYAVSAGFSLGLVALGRGEDNIGSMEAFVERLFKYVGGKEIYSERSMTLTASADDHNRGSGQIMDGPPLNVDVTAPGAIIALALMFLKTESELVVSRLSIPCTQFELQYIRPDFIMLRVIARNLIMWSRVHPSKDWINSQIPEIIQHGIRDFGDECDVDEMDAEAFIQAYVNIVAGACISIGLKFAGTRNADAQELLYNYAIYFLNEIKPVSDKSFITFPKGLSSYVDRGTLEICLHLIVLSLSVVMAGSGHLQTLRFLKFLRSRNPSDGHAIYGSQMAVSLAIGFLFLGSGLRTFSTTNSAIAALLITLYPRLPTGPNDNRCHLQAFRHLYVLATEARWIQTVDVDTGLPVYAPLEVTIKESEHYGETSFCEVTPCVLPERALLKTVRVCGPRYWPQVMELIPEEKPWWSIGDKNDPFNSGVLYIKRKVGACSYVDDPVGCQSLLSRAKHKVFGFAISGGSISSMNDGSGAATIDQLVSTFSSDPSLIAFAQLCCDSSWNNRSDTDFKEFCLQVLFECVSKDRPALLQVYLSMYTMLGAMTDQVIGGASFLIDSLFICSLKLALAYNEALLAKRFTNSRGSIIQSTFLGALSKRVDDLLKLDSVLEKHFHNYLELGRWPTEDLQRGDFSVILSWYLQWYNVPSPAVIRSTLDKLETLQKASLPFLRLLLPKTRIKALKEIEKFLLS